MPCKPWQLQCNTNEKSKTFFFFWPVSLKFGARNQQLARRQDNSRAILAKNILLFVKLILIKNKRSQYYARQKQPQPWHSWILSSLLLPKKKKTFTGSGQDSQLDSTVLTAARLRVRPPCVRSYQPSEVHFQDPKKKTGAKSTLLLCSPLLGCKSISFLACFTNNKLVAIYTLGWRETI